MVKNTPMHSLYAAMSTRPERRRSGDADRPRADNIVVLVALLNPNKEEVAHDVCDRRVDGAVVEGANEIPQREAVL